MLARVAQIATREHSQKRGSKWVHVVATAVIGFRESAPLKINMVYLKMAPEGIGDSDLGNPSCLGSMLNLGREIVKLGS